MENYQEAFLCRFDDTNALHSSGRKVAAIHFGGITVECLLKAMLMSSISPNALKEWKTNDNEPGHTLSNPGHSFVEALKRYEKLYYRAQQFKHVMKWISDVEHPNQHFIDMRYSCDVPDDDTYKQWFNSYSCLVRWLQKQSQML